MSHEPSDEEDIIRGYAEVYGFPSDPPIARLAAQRDAERARAERYERAMGRAVAMLKHHRSASVRAAAVELSEALAADREGRA